MSDFLKGWMWGVTVFAITFMIIALLSTRADADEPKFHFRDCIQMTSGFYSGCLGRVENFYPETKEQYWSLETNKHVIVQIFRYQVMGICKGKPYQTLSLENELTLAHGVKCNAD